MKAADPAFQKVRIPLFHFTAQTLTPEALHPSILSAASGGVWKSSLDLRRTYAFVEGLR